MTTSDSIALSGVIIFFIQAVLLAWYAWETRQIRLDAFEQTKLLARQLEMLTHQNENIQRDFERTFAREDMEAKPFLFWKEGNSPGPNQRTISFENLGATFLILQMQCTPPGGLLTPTHLITGGKGDVYTLLFQSDIQLQIFFGFRYLNKFKQEKEIVYRLDMNSHKPCIDSKPYNQIAGVYTVYVQKGELL
jgi:hypothetical protein